MLGSMFLEMLQVFKDTGELAYDGPLYARFLAMTNDMLGPSPMHINYVSYLYDRLCIGQTNFPGPIESVICKVAFILTFLVVQVNLDMTDNCTTDFCI